MFQRVGTNPNGWEPKKIRNFARIQRRFASCYAYFYLQELMDFIVPRQGALLKSVTWQTRIQHEDPDYLIISTNTHPRDHSRYVFGIDPRGYQFQILQARVIYLRQGFYSQLLCITCLIQFGSTQANFIFQNVTGLDLFAIDKLAMEIHKNLRRALVAYSASFAPPSCSPLMRSIKSFECAQGVLMRLLNFTLASAPSNKIFDSSVFNIRKPPSSAILGNIFASSNLPQWIGNHSRWLSYDWLVTAETFNTFTFAWVITEPSLTHSALWDGLDIISWILVLMSVSLVILTLKLVRKRDVPTVSSFQIVIFLMLDQGQLPPRKSLKILGVQAGALVSIWALTCVVITNGYKGNMFSLLTAISSPQVPQTLDEVLELKTHLMTRAAYRSTKGDVKSMIHNTIFELHQHGSLSFNLHETISRLSHRVVFTTAQTAEIAYSQTGQGIKSNSTYLHMPGKFPQLPKTYIYIGDAEDVSLYSMLLAVNKKKPLILQGPTIDLFWQRFPLLILRNFFTEVYKQAMFRIVESGLWSLWDKYGHVNSNVRSMNDFIYLARRSMYDSGNFTGVHDMLQKMPRQRWWNILGLIWGKSIFNKGTMVIGGLKMEAFTVVFAVFAAGNFVGLTGCIIEICHFKFSGNTRTPVFVF
ncbi:unnamed protein product [Allacma fusca]|uniref:Uncharacterized protein n=1 Tax=Allacma fusca TaxID=39272 RepID=A0A8J2NPJ9_9HEXA|nr:unnamed protein product [Allacma fusca]